jgi:N-acetylmuramoyl-L-alanine amidase
LILAGSFHLSAADRRWSLQKISKKVVEKVSPKRKPPLARSGLESFMRRNGFDYRVSADRRSIFCSKSTGTCSFFSASKEIRFNGTKVFLSWPLSNRRGQFFIADVDIKKCLTPLLNVETQAKKKSSFTIVLDPGHGGTSKGAESVFQKYLEKDLTLTTALALRSLLEAKGFRVLLTRDRDVHVPLEQRTEIANCAGADLFLSLHYNASTHSEACGVEVHVYTLAHQPSTERMQLVSEDEKVHPANQNDAANLRLAFEVQSGLWKNLGANDRGVRHSRFRVLENLRCPGILVEGGFLSHPVEARKIVTEDYRKRLVQTIFEAIDRYIKSAYVIVFPMPKGSLKK